MEEFLSWAGLHSSTGGLLDQVGGCGEPDLARPFTLRPKPWSQRTANVAVGSLAEVGPLAGYVRSNPDSRHRQVVSACPPKVNTDAMASMQLVQEGFVKITAWQHSDSCHTTCHDEDDGILSRSVNFL